MICLCRRTLCSHCVSVPRLLLGLICVIRDFFLFFNFTDIETNFFFFHFILFLHLYNIEDYTKAEYLHWGKNAGCDFLTEKCNKGSKETPDMQLQTENYFCNEIYSGSETTSTMTGCTQNGLAKAVCSKTTYSTDLPISFQYFTNPLEGGRLAELDYCPMYASTTNGQCTDATQQPSDDAVNYYGNIYSSSSKCIRGTMVRNGFQVPTTISSTCK